MAPGRNKIGFIGLGEAGFHIAKGLLNNGSDQIHAYDIRFNDTREGESIQRLASSIGVIVNTSVEELCNSCTIIICATNAKSAILVAKEAKPHLRQHHIYVDLNAASSMLKIRIAEELEFCQAQFVDAAVMESVPRFGHKVPMLVSGRGASIFKDFADENGMDVTFLNEEAGSASGVKMLRSVFMKGLSALLLETLLASEVYGATQTIMNSLGSTLLAKAFEDTVNGLLTRTAIHAERRMGEMEEVIHTLNSLGVDSTMSQAVKKKLEMLVKAELPQRFHFQVPNSFEEVLTELRSYKAGDQDGQ